MNTKELNIMCRRRITNLPLHLEAMTEGFIRGIPKLSKNWLFAAMFCSLSASYSETSGGTSDSKATGGATLTCYCSLKYSNKQ